MKLINVLFLLFPLLLFGIIDKNSSTWDYETNEPINMSTNKCVRVVSDSIIIFNNKNSITLTRYDIIELPINFPTEIDSIRSVLFDMILESELTEEEMTIVLDIYDEWDVGIEYITDDLFKYDNQLWKVNQPHTSQADWMPGQGTDALYSPASPGNVIPDWVQPQGAHDAYNIGELVQFNGHVYESQINANVWSPSAYPAGWQLIE